MVRNSDFDKGLSRTRGMVDYVYINLTILDSLLIELAKHVVLPKFINPADGLTKQIRVGEAKDCLVTKLHTNPLTYLPRSKIVQTRIGGGTLMPEYRTDSGRSLSFSISSTSPQRRRRHASFTKIVRASVSISEPVASMMVSDLDL